MKLESHKVYMIKRHSDGLYSTGGLPARFTHKGKVWNSLGALKNHLNLYLAYRNSKDFPYPYAGCSVYAIRVVTTTTQEEFIPVDDIFDDMIKKNEKRESGRISAVKHGCANVQ